MHARYFSAHVGRFLSPDLLTGSPRVPQSWNRYSYVLGNPMKYVDPYGLFPCPGLPELECQVAINVVGELLDTGGFNGFLRFSSFLQNLQLFDGGPRTGFGLFDVQTAQHFYRTGFEQSAGEGNDGSAFFFFTVNELFIPESQGELGVELGMAAFPVGKFGKLGSWRRRLSAPRENSQ